MRGRRVTIVNDVVNAGSAVRGAFRDLQSLGATVIAVASLVTLGDAFAVFAAEHKIPVESLAHFPNNLWTPAECPLCAAGMALEHLVIS